MKRSVRANLLLTLTALIWGAAFVAQDVAADSLGSFTFKRPAHGAGRAGDVAGRCRTGPKGPQSRTAMLLAGNVPGAAQDASDRGRVLRRDAGAGQRLSADGHCHGHERGQGGFITALYIVLVPLLACFGDADPRGWYGCCPFERGWAVPSVHRRGLLHRAGRRAAHPLRAVLFRPHSGGGSFQPPDGLREDELPAILPRRQRCVWAWRCSRNPLTRKPL